MREWKKIESFDFKEIIFEEYNHCLLYTSIAQSLQCHLLGMRRTSDAGEVLVRHIVNLMEIL